MYIKADHFLYCTNIPALLCWGCRKTGKEEGLGCKWVSSSSFVMPKHLWMSFDPEVGWAGKEIHNFLSIHVSFTLFTFCLNKGVLLGLFLLCGTGFTHKPINQAPFPSPSSLWQHGQGELCWGVRAESLRGHTKDLNVQSLIFLKFCKVTQPLHRGVSLSSGVLPRPHVQKFLIQCSTWYNSPAMNITGCIADILKAFLSLQILLQKIGI